MEHKPMSRDANPHVLIAAIRAAMMEDVTDAPDEVREMLWAVVEMNVKSDYAARLRPNEEYDSPE